MMQELSEDIYIIEFDKLADGTKAVLGDTEHARERRIEAVDFQTAIKDKIKTSPARRGYVYRSSIAMFQTGEINCLDEYITPFDYAKLDKEQQQEYSYYEWDDRDGLYEFFKRIAYRVDFLVCSFNDCNVPYEMYKGLAEKEIKEKDVRLIIVQN